MPTRTRTRWSVGLLVLWCGAWLASPGWAAEGWNPTLLSKAQQEKLESLSLTDEQKSQIAALPESQAAWRKENEEKLTSLREQLQAARESGDMEQIRALAKQRKQIVETRPGYGQILTAEQRRELQAVGRGKGKGKSRPPASEEVRALRREIAEARSDGDAERVAELQQQLREQIRADRQTRPGGGAPPAQ